MPRHLLLPLLLSLTACQDNAARNRPPAAGGAPSTFDSGTVQSYNVQNGQFQQQPPFGARSNQTQ